jgi:HSP20 family protein
MDQARSNPFRGFVDVMSEMNRIREVGRGNYEPANEDRERTQASAWIPTADVFARDEDLVIRMELSGVARENIEITLHENTLTVSGRRESDLDEEVSFYVHERFYGAFRRSMTLPAGVKEEAVNAFSDNGLLQITVRGGAAARAHRIEIRDRPE